MSRRYTSVLIAMLAGCTAAASVAVSPQTIPLGNAQAYVFSVPLTNDTPPRLFVLDGHALSIHDSSAMGEPILIQLPQLTTAVDIYDVDSDGIAEILVVAGTAVQRRTIAPNQAGSAWETVFERASLYSDTAALPFPQVLLVERAGENVIALPQLSGFEFWSLKGRLVESLDYGQSQDASTVTPLPFEVTFDREASVGPGSDMVHRISSHRDPAPVDSSYRVSIPRASVPRITDFSDLPSDQWPSFPLRLDGSEVAVLHAPVPPKFDDTYIRLRSSESTVDPRERVGPPRRYPGRLIIGGNRLPDFNGDGFVDIVAWKAAVPGTSPGALIGALRDGTWPVILSVHLFNPKSRLYEAEPFAFIRMNLPASWYESTSPGGPIRNIIFEDVDGDGFLDIGFSTSADTYSIWSYKLGFGGAPAYTIRTKGTIESIIRGVEIGPSGSNPLLLRGLDAVYVVRFPQN